MFLKSKHISWRHIASTSSADDSIKKTDCLHEISKIGLCTIHYVRKICPTMTHFWKSKNRENHQFIRPKTISGFKVCSLETSFVLTHNTYPRVGIIQHFFLSPLQNLVGKGKYKRKCKQECIPVGCLPPACWPYPSMHCGPGGCCTCRGVPAQVLPPPWTDACKNISLRAVKMHKAFRLPDKEHRSRYTIEQHGCWIFYCNLIMRTSEDLICSDFCQISIFS